MARCEAVVFRRSYFQDGNAVINAAQRLRICGILNGEQLEERIRWISQRRVSTYASLADIDVTGLTAERSGCCCEVGFFYDAGRCGMPFRRGSNKDYNNPKSQLYRKNVLNERAFVLSDGQYGRIIWNERLSDADTGEWFYRLHIYNLFNAAGAFNGTEFVARALDFLYEQTAALY
ncbi:hypothetical protein [uncultured Cloacibacillus sp.]|uniref:hypothetical protein n=1 Tax=uncultured Cloacibacillus sp. TaxID=889794 RepID=UPI0026DC0C99|nr:hypothetical protein [uncultured Cloacibacillus sp.]